MSNNKMATKADLQEMYQRILPYLGGMPEVLANKFSKGDMYSADEKMIGQWVDGKPLYSKTIQIVIPTAGSDTTVSLSSLGIDNLINLKSSISVFNTMPVIDGYMAEPSSSLITRVQVFMGSAGTLYVRNIGYTAEAGKTIYVTLKYTKTTDSPVSIGNDTDYSTTEKIVGTWIDGRPIWQKTIDFGALPNKTSKSVAHNISNISIVCNIYGIGVGSNIYQPFPILNDATPNKSVALWCDNTNVTVRATNEDYSAMVGYITIQYVKATS